MLVTKRVLNEIDTITNYENVAILEENTTPRISKMDRKIRLVNLYWKLNR